MKIKSLKSKCKYVKLKGRMSNRDSEGIRGKTRIYLDILTKRLRIYKKMKTAAIFV